MNKKIPAYAYPEKLLLQRLDDCKTLEELVETGSFYRDMEMENLIIITRRIKLFVMVKQNELITNGKYK